MFIHLDSIALKKGIVNDVSDLLKVIAKW